MHVCTALLCSERQSAAAWPVRWCDAFVLSHAEPLSGSDLVTLADETFDEVTGIAVGDKGSWFVKFYAPWYVIRVLR